MTKYNPEERADLATVRETMGVDDDAKYAAARKAFEATARDELPRDISKPGGMFAPPASSYSASILSLFAYDLRLHSLDPYSSCSSPSHQEQE